MQADCLLRQRPSSSCRFQVSLCLVLIGQSSGSSCWHPYRNVLAFLKSCTSCRLHILLLLLCCRHGRAELSSLRHHAATAVPLLRPSSSRTSCLWPRLVSRATPPPPPLPVMACCDVDTVPPAPLAEHREATSGRAGAPAGAHESGRAPSPLHR